jgi:hypothetical protein
MENSHAARSHPMRVGARFATTGERSLGEFLEHYLQ